MIDANDEFGLELSAGLNRRRELSYAFCAASFAVLLVLTNIIGVKLFEIFPGTVGLRGRPDWPGFGLGAVWEQVRWGWDYGVTFFQRARPDWFPGADRGSITLTSGLITYPLTFLLTDIVSEIWGRRRASFMVALGFVMSLLMLATIWVARELPVSAFWTVEAMGVTDSAETQRAFETTFYFPGLLLFASMTAYLVAQLFDVRLYHFWWRVTGGRFMWIRNNGSTMISQLVDTIIVNGIYLRWGLEMEWKTIATIIIAVYFCKLILAIIDTPLIYITRAWMVRFLRLPKGALAEAPLADPV